MMSSCQFYTLLMSALMLTVIMFPFPSALDEDMFIETYDQVIKRFPSTEMNDILMTSTIEQLLVVRMHPRDEKELAYAMSLLEDIWFGKDCSERLFFVDWTANFTKKYASISREQYAEEIVDLDAYHVQTFEIEGQFLY